MSEHVCLKADKIEDIKEDTNEIKVDIKEIKKDLAQHISRTAANETRIDIMEKFVVKSGNTQQANFKALIEINENAMKQFNKQLKISLGIFAGLATLITALAAWINHG